MKRPCRLFVRRPDVHRMPKMLSDAEIEISCNEVCAEMNEELEMVVNPVVVSTAETSENTEAHATTRTRSIEYDLAREPRSAKSLYSQSVCNLFHGS